MRYSTFLLVSRAFTFPSCRCWSAFESRLDDTGIKTGKFTTVLVELQIEILVPNLHAVIYF